MSGNTEKKIEDTQGKYLHAIKAGRELKDAEWQNCRIVLTTERLMVVTDEKISMPLDKVDVLDERRDVNRAAASEAYYMTLELGEDVLLMTTADFQGFRTNFFRSILDGAVIYVQHPAVVGGVVKAKEWQRGRLKVTDEAVRAVLEDGGKLVIERDDIGEMETDERAIAGERRSVIEVEHTNEERTSVQTYLSGREYHIGVLKQLLEEGAEQNRADLDLSATEQRVVMALYSGVSPFAISEFVGIDVDKVEEIYDQLIELDVIEEVRRRKEVSLTPQGRKIAGDAMGEQ
jgi:helix-turn-helix protein